MVQQHMVGHNACLLNNRLCRNSKDAFISIIVIWDNECWYCSRKVYLKQGRLRDGVGRLTAECYAQLIEDHTNSACLMAQI
jgi:hypothetical protein